MAIEKIMLKINGLDSESATYACQSVIMQLKEVKSVEVDLGTEIAIVETEDSKITKKEIQKAIEKIGFSVTYP